MPLEYPFTELGMGEGVFMGAAKTFSKNLRIEGCSYTSIPQVFWAQSQHRTQKILEIKKPIEYRSMGKKQRLPHF
jgi:hypothetical protein